MKCIVCGKEFIALDNRGRRKYCPDCRPKYRRKTTDKVICAVCGKEVPRSGRAQKYCPACAKEQAKQRQEQYRAQCRALEDVPRHCLRCGAPVEGKRLVCDSCKAAHEREYQREYHRRLRAKK